MGGDSDQLGWVCRPNEARPTPIDPMKTVMGSSDTGTRNKINVISQDIRTVIAYSSRVTGLSAKDIPLRRERSAITVRTNCDITLIFYGYPYRINPLRFARRLWGLGLPHRDGRPNPIGQNPRPPFT